MKKENCFISQEYYLYQLKEKKKRIFIIRILIFVVFLAGWELFTTIGILNPFLLSSPSRIVLCAYQLALDGSLFYHLFVTLAETFISFALILVFGILIAVLLWWNDTLASILEPYLVVLNSLPKSALAPVFIVWLGNNIRTVIVAAVSVAVFGAVITLYSSFIGTEEEKIKLIYTLGGKKKDVLFKVVLPSNFPVIVSVMKVSIGLSLVGVIIGEFLAANAGLGYLIIYGSQVFKLDWIMMSIVLLCIVATGLYQLLAMLERKAVK
jgi:NitT/TauT family transport system permease protein